LIVIDIFSKFAYALPLKTKASAEVAEAFERIWRKAAGRTRRMEKGADVPREVSTDAGAEFRREVTRFLQSKGIDHTFKEQQNSLAVVDSAQRTIKTMLAKELLGSGSDGWATALPKAIQA
jgi:hypothetical protein